MRSPFSVRALLLFAALLLTGLPGASRAQSSFTASGIVQLEGLYTGLSSGPAYTIYDPVQTVVFIFTSTNAAQTTPTVFTRSAQIGTNGLFSLSNIPANSYTVWVYHSKWLAENMTVDTTNGNVTGLNVLLPAGDANSDNGVDSTDFGLLIGAYNTSASVPNSGYDEIADFNNDGFVDSTDFSLLIGNFGMLGAYPPSSSPQVGASVIMDFPAPDYGAAVVPMDGASAGGEVNLTSGVYENHPGADLDAFNPVGASPAYARTYHSGRASQGYGSPGLAPGWIDNYDYTIFAPALSGGWGPLVLIYPNGAMDTISPNLDAAHHPVPSTSAAAVLSGGAYLFTAPAQVPYFVTGSLSAATQAGAWDKLYVTFADNKQMVFSPVGGGLYRYTALVDLKHDPNINPVGRTLSINRDALGRVVTIANDNGAGQTLLQFQYTGNGLTSLTDAAGLRAVYYGWANAQLHTVSQIAPSSQTMNNTASLWQYDYQVVNTWNLLKTITLPSPMPAAIAPPTVVMSYDGGGRVLQISDENSHVRQYNYNGAGGTIVAVPTGVVNAADGAASQSWTQHFSRNRGTGISQSYTDAANLPVNINTSVVYTESNPYLINQATDAYSNITHYTYDGTTGNLTSVQKPINGSSVTSIYTYRAEINPLGWLTRIDTRSDLDGVVKIPTTFEYYTATTPSGLRGQISAIWTPMPNGLNPGGLTPPGALDFTNPAIKAAYQVPTTFTYTLLGNIASVTSPAPNLVNVAGDTVTTTFNYVSDAYTNTSGDGHALAVSEALGQPLQVTSPFQASKDAAITTRTQHYRYDTRGNLSTTLSDSGTIRSDYWYNDANQVKISAAPLLRQLNVPIPTRLTSIIDYAYTGGPARSVSRYAYPVDSTTGLPVPQQGMAPLRQVTTTYGAAQEVKSIAGSTAPVSLSYDNAYQMTGLSDANGQANNYGSRFKYDGGGNLFQHVWPGGKSVGLAYDGKGSLLSTTSARGTTATLAFSPDHTVVTGIASVNALHPNLVLPGVVYAYDDFGRVGTIIDSTTAMTYAYDDSNNVLSVITKYAPAQVGANDDPLTQQVAYTYNTDGTLGETKWYSGPPPKVASVPTSGLVLASFRPATGKRKDPRQAWIDATDPLSRGGFPSGGTRTVYPISPLLPVGQPVSNWNAFAEQNGDTYDADGHLTGASNDALKTGHGYCGPCLAASLTYQGVNCAFLTGNLLTACLQQATAPQALAVALPLPQFVNYVYDPLNNLRSYQTILDANGLTAGTTYTYDDGSQRDRLRGETYVVTRPSNDGSPIPQRVSGFNLTFAPDLADNLTDFTAQNYIGNNVTVLTHTGYRYNADNQILGDNANGTYGYDFDGNQQATGSAATGSAVMAYDAANRLVSYTRGNLALTFGYRPDGLRAWKATNGGARTYYYYDGSRLQFELTQQTDGSWATTRYYAWDASGIYESWTPGEGRIAYLFDPQGSAVSRCTERGSSPGVWSSAAVYDAYGQVRQYDATDTLSDPVGYNGQSGYYTDVASLAANGTQAAQPGLILCGHRYYSPDLARWLTRDPIGYEGGINVYAYCGNNPIGHVDPSGLDVTITIVARPVSFAANAAYHIFILIEGTDRNGKHIAYAISAGPVGGGLSLSNIWNANLYGRILIHQGTYKPGAYDSPFDKQGNIKNDGDTKDTRKRRIIYFDAWGNPNDIINALQPYLQKINDAQIYYSAIRNNSNTAAYTILRYIFRILGEPFPLYLEGDGNSITSNTANLGVEIPGYGSMLPGCK